MNVAVNLSKTVRLGLVDRVLQEQSVVGALDAIKDAIRNDTTKLEIRGLLSEAVFACIQLLPLITVLDANGASFGDVVNAAYLPEDLIELRLNNYEVDNILDIARLKKLITLEVKSCGNFNSITGLDSLEHLYLPSDITNLRLRNFLLLTKKTSSWDEAADFYGTLKVLNGFDPAVNGWPPANNELLKEQLVCIRQSNLKSINFGGKHGHTVLLNELVSDAQAYDGSHLRAAIAKFKASGFYESEHEGRLIAAEDFVQWPGLDVRTLGDNSFIEG